MMQAKGQNLDVRKREKVKVRNVAKRVNFGEMYVTYGHFANPNISAPSISLSCLIL